MRASRLLPAAASLAAVTVAVLAAYRLVAFGERVLSGHDLQTYFFPLRSYARETLLAGRLPLWNPYLFMGAPFLANPQAATLYPLNLALLPLDAIRALTASVVMHVWLGAVGAALFARKGLGVGWPAATVGGVAFGIGGYLSGQTGHPNQLAVLAWLPFALLAVPGLLGARRRWAFVLLACVFGLQLTAGHPQQAYISTAVAAAYLLFQFLRRLGAGRGERGIAVATALFVAAVALGAGLAAVQLFPTALLSSLSIRAGGLTVYEAGSFSLPLQELGTALLPSYVRGPSSQEFLAYVGFVGWWLAAIGIARIRSNPHALFFFLLAAATLLLALGPATPVFKAAHAWIPGFDLFRVPARWLGGTNFALACLAAIGFDAISTKAASPRAIWAAWGGGAAALVLMGAATVLRQDDGRASMAVVWGSAAAAALVSLAPALKWRRAWSVLVPAALAAELIVAQAPLELAKPVPAEAYVDQGRVIPLIPAGAGGPRVLGLAEPSYEVNDADRTVLEARHLAELGRPSFTQLLVALKYRDSLSPNLSLSYGRATPDGYDGGVLPLRDYVALKQVLLREGASAPDAILRNQIDGMPDGRSLDVLGVGYVLADRKNDLEHGGVFFDTEVTLEVAPGSQAEIRLANAAVVAGIGLLGTVRQIGAANALDPAAWLDLMDGGTRIATFAIRGGAQVPQGGLVAVLEGSSATKLSENAYASILSLSEPPRVTVLRMRAAPGAAFSVGAVTLTAANGVQIPVPLLTDRTAELFYWTDVKVYRFNDPIARVRFVDELAIAKTPEEAAAALGRPEFDQRKQAILELAATQGAPARPLLGWLGDRLRDAGLRAPRSRAGSMSASDAATLTAKADAMETSALGLPSYRLPGASLDRSAEITRYEAERVEVKTQASAASMLVLGDTLYPGWNVSVDGEEARLLRANLLFRAVEVPAGMHVVRFNFEPREVVLGAVVSGVSAVIVLAVAAAPSLRRKGPRRRS